MVQESLLFVISLLFMVLLLVMLVPLPATMLPPVAGS